MKKPSKFKRFVGFIYYVVMFVIIGWAITQINQAREDGNIIHQKLEAIHDDGEAHQRVLRVGTLTRVYAHAREEPFTTTVDALRSLTMVNWCHRTPLAFEVLRRLRDIMLESEVEKQLVKRVEEHGGEALKLGTSKSSWLVRPHCIPSRR